MKPFINSLSALQRSGGTSSPWETAKFALRGCWQWRAHSTWSRFLLDDERLRAWAMAHPHLLWKLQRPYLQRSLTLPRKLTCLQDHYHWVLQHCPEPLQQALRLGGRVTLAEVLPESAAEDVRFRVELGVDPQFAKEGECTLALWRNDVRLALLAFAVYREDGHWVAHIGCLQGPPGTNQGELIRDATKELHGLRPKQAVLLALYGLLKAAGTPAEAGLRAVSNAGHIYQGKSRRRERVVADYDSFWCEFEAQLRGEVFHLPAALPRKALEDVPTRKRAQYRRRFQFEDRLVEQIAASLSAAG